MFDLPPKELLYNKPIEEDYCLRGHILFLYDKIYDGKNFPLAVYNFAVIGLVKKEYIKLLNANCLSTPFGKFLGKQCDSEFIHRLSDQGKLFEMIIGVFENQVKMVQKEIQNMGVMNIIDFSEYEGIMETKYVRDLMQAREETIILNIDFRFLTILPFKDSSKIAEYEKNIYSILVRYIGKSKKEREKSIIHWFIQYFYDIAKFSRITRYEYLQMLFKIANFSNEWIENLKTKQDLSDPYIKSLREFYTEFHPFDKEKHEPTLNKLQKERFEPLRELCFQFYDTFLDDIVKTGELHRCKYKFCRNVFKEKGKLEYCTRYCEKRAAYLRRKQKIKEKLFEELWEKYPKRYNKREAKKHFMATVNTKKDQKEIKNALKNYVSHTKDINRRDIMSSKCWFNNWKRWVVYHKTKTRGK